MKDIELQRYNYATNKTEDIGTVGIRDLASSMTPEDFANLLDHYLNLNGKQFNEGKDVGLKLRSTHRTLQRSAICFAFGIICGLPEQEFMDDRNATAVTTAKKVAELMKDGQLPLGWYL